MHWASFALALAILVALPRPAFAYIDPGSGSMMLQVLLGGVAAALVSIRMFWARLVHRTRSHPEPDPSAGEVPRH